MSQDHDPVADSKYDSSPTAEEVPQIQFNQPTHPQ